jgi:hypothetical protein
MNASEEPVRATTRRGVLVAAAGGIGVAVAPAAAAAQPPEPTRRVPTAAEAFRQGPATASADPAAATEHPATDGTLHTEGFHKPGDGGGARYREISPPASPQAWQGRTSDGVWWELAETEVDVRQFGARADGETDDIQAFRDALAYAKAKRLRNVVARGRFAFGSTWDIDDVSNQGIGIAVEELVALESWPAPSSWRSADPLIRLGKSSKGSMINIDLRIGSLRGAERKADGISIGGGGPGIAISQIWIGDAQDCNIAVKISGQTQPAASNRLTGNSVRNNNVGIYLDGQPRMCEGTRIQFNFIWSNSFGGLIAGRGTQYLDVHSQFDFNGQDLAEVCIGQDIDDLADYEKVSIDSGHEFEIVARYATGGKNFLLLLDESRLARNDEPIKAGSVLRTDHTENEVISIKRVDENKSRFYFDIILSATGQPFHRAIINCPYLGGIVGQNLHTCSIFRGNSNEAGTVWLAGHGFAASATQLLFYDALRTGYTTKSQPPWLEVTADLVRPRRDVYLPDHRIFSSETAKTLRKGAWGSFFTPGTEAIPAHGRRWLLSAQAIDKASTQAIGLLVQDAKGTLAATALGASGIGFRVHDNALQIRQDDDMEARIILSAIQIG